MKTKQRWIVLSTVMTLVMILGCLALPPAGSVSQAASSAKVTKLTVKTTSTMLNEGQILTKSMLKKSLNVTARLKNGTTKKKYTSYNSKQIGKTIKPNSKGNFKVTLTAGSAKKSVSIKVNRIKKIYFKNPNPKSLTEGNKFDVTAFKRDYPVYAKYKKGADKKLTTYTVSAPSIVKADANGKFNVTVKYGKNTATISIPVTKTSTEATTTEDPSQEQPTPGQPTVGEDPTEDPTPEVPAVEEVDWLYYQEYNKNMFYSLQPERLEVWVYPRMVLPEGYDFQEWGVLSDDTIPNIKGHLLTATYEPITNNVIPSCLIISVKKVL